MVKFITHLYKFILEVDRWFSCLLHNFKSFFYFFFPGGIGILIFLREELSELWQSTRVLHGLAVQRGNPQLRLSWGSPTWLEAWAGVIITQHPQKSDSGWSSWCNLQLGWRSKSLPRQLCHSQLGDYFLIYSSREVQLAASFQAAAQLPATSSDLRGNTQQLPGQRAKPKIKHFLSQARSCLGSTSASCSCAGIRSPVWKSWAALKYQRRAGMSLIALQCTLPMQTCNWRAETSYW